MHEMARTSLAKASGLWVVSCEAEQEEGDERDGDLDADGVLGGAEEAGDLQGLLDPAEEQLYRPAPLIEVCDRLSGRGEVGREDAQHPATLGLDPNFAHGVLVGIAPVLG